MPAALLSLDTVIAVTGLSKRTLWRRIAEGTLRKVSEDARGRALLDASDVAPLMPVALKAGDLDVLIQADNGSPQAQADMGAVFYDRNNREAAVYWWRLAAEQGNSDAMQSLGMCYAAGHAVSPDPHLAVMWISKAAAQGHTIAVAQMQIFLGGKTA